MKDIKEFIKTAKWSYSIIENRIIEKCKSDINLEYTLTKAIINICGGKYKQVKNNSVLSTYNNDNKCVDWSVIIDEKTKILKIKIYNVRYSGTNEELKNTIIKELNKNGPEWNEVCDYKNGPIKLNELPFKGKRPPIKVEVKRDRDYERIQAQKLVASFKRR